jgi:hypothetical protein
MDEAFLPFNEMIDKMVAIEGEFYTDDKGIHSYIYEFEVMTPIELDILTDENGKVTVGIIPPLYRVETTFRPSFHSITFTAIKYEQ